jgi:hypothetical protein
MSWRARTYLIVTRETRTRGALRMRHLIREGTITIAGVRFAAGRLNFDGR